MKAGLGELPVAHYRLRGDSEHLGCFLYAQAAKEAQLNHPAFPGVDTSQRAQRLIQRQQIDPRLFRGLGSFLQRDVDRSLPALLVAAGAGQVDEDLAHQLGADSEEMSPVLPGPFLEINNPQVDLVDEDGGLENVPGWLSCHIAMGALVQLTVNEGGQFLQRLLVAGSPSPQQGGNFVRTRSSHVSAFRLRSSAGKVITVFHPFPSAYRIG